VVDSQSTDGLRMGNFDEQVWRGFRERDQLLGGELTATATAAGFRVDLWVPA
jgi:hypothetical protein